MTATTSLEPRLRARLEADLATAEQAEDASIEASTLRLILCAVHDRDAEARAHDHCSGCDDTVIRDVLELMVRQREDSAARYEDAGRIEMASREQDEAEVIKRYLPKPLEGEALSEAVDNVINDLDAHGLKDLGRCMSELKNRYSDCLDTRKANKLVKKSLVE